jgi:hypothetical protein
MAHPANELIWHFLGYLKLYGPHLSQADIYEGGAAQGRFVSFDPFAAQRKKPPEDEEETFPARPALPEPLVIDTPTPFAMEGPAADWLPEVFNPTRLREVADYTGRALPELSPAPPPTSFHIDARYALKGPESHVATLASRNTLFDDDVLTTEAVPYVPATGPAEIASAFGSLTTLAEAETPRLLAFDDASMNAGTGDILTRQVAGQTARADGSAAALESRITDAEGAQNSGFTEWGVFKPLDALGLGLDADPEDEDDNDDEDGDEPTPAERVGATEGEAFLTGGNEATNVAAIIHAQNASSSFLILGDFHETFAVAQINVVMVDGAIAPAPAGFKPEDALAPGNNLVANDAALVFSDTQITVTAPLGHAFASYQFNVDYIMGDFIDATYIRQDNRLSDNDLANFDAAVQAYYISTGGNVLVNAAQFISMGHKYDLIVVGGDYHKFLSISQTNILMNVDGMMVYDMAQGRMDADRLFERDGNRVQNEADIINIGGGSLMRPMHPDVAAMADKLLVRETSFDVEPFPTDWGMPYYGAPVLNVLFITGDYLKLLAIDQINHVSDADHGLIITGRGSQGSLAQSALAQQGRSSDSEATPSTTASDTGAVFLSGQNTLSNKATIIHYDSQSAFQYLGGAHYRDDMLVQANIVVPDSNPVGMRMANDPSPLVSEIIAFLNGEPASGNGPAEFHGTSGLYHSDDMMGGVLT